MWGRPYLYTPFPVTPGGAVWAKPLNGGNGGNGGNRGKAYIYIYICIYMCIYVYARMYMHNLSLWHMFWEMDF